MDARCVFYDGCKLFQLVHSSIFGRGFSGAPPHRRQARGVPAKLAQRRGDAADHRGRRQARSRIRPRCAQHPIAPPPPPAPDAPPPVSIKFARHHDPFQPALHRYNMHVPCHHHLRQLLAWPKRHEPHIPAPDLFAATSSPARFAPSPINTRPMFSLRSSAAAFSKVSQAP